MNDLPYNFGNINYCEMGCHEQIVTNKHLLNFPTINGFTNKLHIGGKQQRKNIQEFTNTRIEYLRDLV